MRKTVLMIAFMTTVAGALAQTGNVLPLEVAQQRARFAREQMADAQRTVKAAQKRDQVAKKRVEEAKAQAELAAKALQDAEAAFAQARGRHDQAYQDLKRAHDAMQESAKPQ